MREIDAVPASGKRHAKRRRLARLAQAAQVDAHLAVDAQSTPKRRNQQRNPVKVDFAGLGLGATNPL